MKGIIKILAISLTIGAASPVMANENQATNTTQAVSVSAGFLHSVEGTYGWNPVEGDISYDFFSDGRLHIQGADGEATMWEGKWTLLANQLTLVNTTLNTTKTVTATKEGNELLLDDKRYHRYRP
ncbi:MAG: hypothetical protein GQ569_02745 [Methylococcaceae bacterium]|nr:hypothetical protein [Methylococcaceae bacterium]